MYRDSDSFIRKLVEERKKPLLLLLLKNVGVFELIEVEKILKDKKFETLDVLLQTVGGSPD